MYRDLALINRKFGFTTGELYKTKDGIRYIGLPEQLSRRVAGAISTVFEPRRSKDIVKVYDNIKFLEALKRNILRRKLAKPTLLQKILGVDKKLKKEINKLNKLSKELLKDKLRQKLIHSTKGHIETVDLREINLIANKVRKAYKNKKISSIKADDVEKIAQKTHKYLTTRFKSSLPDKKYKRLFKSLWSKLRKSKSVSLSSFVGMLLLKSRSLMRSRSASKSRSISKVIPVSRSVSISKSKSKSASKSKSVSISKSVSKSKSKSKSKSISTSTSKSTSVSLSKSLSKSLSSSSTSRSLLRSAKKVPKPVKLMGFNWNRKLPAGYVRLVNILIKSKGKIKELKVKTTPNRALALATKLIDNTTARSFKLKIVGVGKGKDIKKPALLKKFRPKVSRTKSVLDIVEKTKYAIDTKGEKKGLKLSKILKKIRGGKNRLLDTKLKSTKRHTAQTIRSKQKRKTSSKTVAKNSKGKSRNNNNKSKLQRKKKNKSHRTAKKKSSASNKSKKRKKR